jgi:hypothetical protein
MGQVIGTTKVGVVGQLLLLINPLPSGFDFLSKMMAVPLVPSSSPNLQLSTSPWSFLPAPVIFSAVVMGVLFFYLSPRLKVEEESIGRLWSKLRRMVGLVVIAGFMLSLSATPVMAHPQAQSGGGDLQLSISIDSKATKTGDEVIFDTIVTNTSAQSSPPVILAMNIINLSKTGDVVDPEDWSPQRTKYIDSLGANQSTTLSWTVNAILDGDFMVYVVAIPHPQNAGTSSQVAASPGLHLTVAKFATLNPSGVLPFVIGVPIIVVLAIFLLFRLRRRQVDAGGTE